MLVWPRVCRRCGRRVGPLEPYHKRRQLCGPCLAHYTALEVRCLPEPAEVAALLATLEREREALATDRVGIATERHLLGAEQQRLTDERNTWMTKALRAEREHTKLREAILKIHCIHHQALNPDVNVTVICDCHERAKAACGSANPTEAR